VWFDRGLPWLQVEAEVLAEDSVSQWFMAHQSWVSELRLCKADDESLRRVVERGLLAQVVALELWATEVTGAGLEHLAGLTQLRHLSLDDFRVTAPGLEHLAGLTRLQKLYLYRVTGWG
jgi:hypothetical protein